MVEWPGGCSSDAAPCLLACVEIEALALQWLRRCRPAWRRLPCAVLSAPGGAGRVVALDAAARAAGVRVGMRYGEALAFEPQLRAEHVPAAVIGRLRREVARRLLAHAPQVCAVGRGGPLAGMEGVFWLDGQGVVGRGRLWSEATGWARAILADLEAFGVSGRVAIGRSQMGTLARLRDGGGARLLVIEGGEEAERALCDALPLGRLGISRRLRRRLERFGWRTLGSLRPVAAHELERRLGAQAAALARMAASGRCEPLERWRERVRCVDRRGFEPPLGNLEALIAAIEQRLSHAIARRPERAIAALRCRLVFEDDGVHEQRLVLLEPCADPRWLAQLLRLRLERSVGRFGRERVQRLELELQPAARRSRARTLWAVGGREEEAFAAAQRAVARLRARFGEQAVCRAVLRDAHLPEAQWRWVPFEGYPRRRGGSRRRDRRRDEGAGGADETGREARRREGREEVGAGGRAQGDDEEQAVSMQRERSAIGSMRRPARLLAGTGGSCRAVAGGAAAGSARSAPWCRVRRVLLQPQRLGRVRDEESKTLIGPWVISGGWWGRERSRRYRIVAEGGRWSWEYEEAGRDAALWRQGWVD